MLTKRLLRKMVVTSAIVVIILLIYLMPGVIEVDNNSFSTAVEYVDLTNNIIYLEDEDGLLVESYVAIVDSDIVSKVKELIKHLSSASKDIIPNGLNSVMPSNIELLDVKYDEEIIDLNFSKELSEIKGKKLIRLIEAISFTILDLDGVNGLSIYVDGTNICELDEKIPSVITKDFGINKKYHFKKTDNIVKYVVYYSKKIDDNSYYVPITKYINSLEDKINIVIEDLSSNYIYQPNLISVVTEELELIDYQINNDVMTLNFNNTIFLNEDGIKEEVVYPVVSTIFSNFDVESVIFQVNGEEILKKTTKNS